MPRSPAGWPPPTSGAPASGAVPSTFSSRPPTLGGRRGRREREWRGKETEEEEVAAFHAARAESGIGPLLAHASYLINLAATDPAILNRSREALADELQRCARLGVDGLVLHPGAHLGAGEEAGIE